MLLLNDGMKLYHGSTVEVPMPDLSKCSPHKDFGQGFYLTSSFEQARAFAQIVARREIRRNPSETFSQAVVSSYELSHADELSIKTYDTANTEWLHCIVAHRQGAPFESVAQSLESYDIIVGKVADDQTNATILAYIAGAYGEMGTRQADEICVNLLLPERLHDQICLRSTKALECLRFMGGEVV